MKKIFILICICFATSTIAQTTLVIYPDRDNTIYEDLPNNSNALGNNLFAGNTNNGIGYARRSLLHFSLSGIPTGSTINSATLQLYCNQTNSGSTTVSINKLITNWGNGTSIGSGTQATGTSATTNDPTWNANFYGTSTWNNSGGDYNLSPSCSTSVSSSNQYYTWSSIQMSNDVQSWLNTPLSNYGWIIIGDESTNQTAKRFASLEDITITNRPSLTIIYTGTLSVNITSFNASISKKDVLLKWETASEENIVSFTIEHSTDGASFTPIATINSNGSKSEYEHYYSPDKNGLHYFRIKVNDINGTFTYTKIVFLVTENQQNSISIIQNPVKNNIMLESNFSLKNNNYKIINSSGELVSNGVISEYSINANNLPSGLYYLIIDQTNNKIALRFLKE